MTDKKLARLWREAVEAYERNGIPEWERDGITGVVGQGGRLYVSVKIVTTFWDLILEEENEL